MLSPCCPGNAEHADLQPGSIPARPTTNTLDMVIYDMFGLSLDDFGPQVDAIIGVG